MNAEEARLCLLLHGISGLEDVLTDVRRITKAHCEAWASKFRPNSSLTAFNNTLGTLRMILDITTISLIRQHFTGRAKIELLVNQMQENR